MHFSTPYVYNLPILVSIKGNSSTTIYGEADGNRRYENPNWFGIVDME